MKVVFVVHSCPVMLDGQQPFSPVRTNTWPQSQVTLASALAGHDVEILDLRSLASPDQWRHVVEPQYLPPIKYGNLTLTRHLVSVDYHARIAACYGDVFVFTANFTAETNSVTEIIRTTKQLHPKSLILVGGRDASAEERREVYFSAGADYIGVGDGDSALPEFLDSLVTGNHPSHRLIEGSISHNFQPVLPNLGLAGLNLSRYTESGGGPIHPAIFSNGGFAAYIETSRGCPRECDFCTEARSERWQLPVPQVICLIDHYIDSGCKLFMFSDDNLLVTKADDLIEIFSYLRQRGAAWEFPVGLEVGLLRDNRGGFKEELIKALFWNSNSLNHFAGVHRLLVPLEDALMHNTGLSKLKRVQSEIGGLLKRLLDTGIPFMNLAIMIGSPGETPDDRKRLEDRLVLIHELVSTSATRVNFSVFCTSPLPGTPFGRLVTAQGRLSHTIEEAPELWTVHCSAINGICYSAEETTNYRRELLKRFQMSQDEGKVSPR